VSSVESSNSRGCHKDRIFSEKVKYIELGKSTHDPLSPSTQRAKKIVNKLAEELLQRVDLKKTENQRKLERMALIQKLMNHKILKMSIQTNCKIKILTQQRLEKEARQRELNLLNGNTGLKEHS
jgi:hypothetical protein